MKNYLYTTKSNFVYAFLYFSMVTYSYLYKRKNSVLKGTSRFNYKVDDALVDRWFKTFNVSMRVDDDRRIPFTYYERPGVLLLMEYLISLGIKPYLIYHLRSEINFISKEIFARRNEVYHIDFSVKEIFILKDLRICLKTNIDVYDSDGNKHVEHCDYFYAIVDDFFVESYINKNKVEVDGVFLEEIQKRENLIFKEDVIKKEIMIEKGLGKKYALISGDFNPIHCTERLLKSLRKGKTAFIQGYCILNIIMKVLAEDLNVDFDSININIKDKVHTDQVVELFYDEPQFALMNSKGGLLAYGDIKKI